jgi:mutual gliding-motility protein MglA
MAFINYKTRELNAKIVYVGPTGAGKTTNLRVIAERTEKQHIGDLVSLEHGSDKTAYFDFLPLFLGKIRGFRSRLHLFTVPGKVPFESSRRMILKGADALVFVADSDPARAQENLECYRQVRTLLKSYGTDPDAAPMVFQWNKRDAENAIPEEELKRLLDIGDRPAFSATATTGQGVFDTLRTASRLVLDSMMKKKA